MQIQYHQWWSPNLNQNMELKVYGHHGVPLLVFPAQSGCFFDFENFGMIHTIHHFIEDGRIKVFTVDSVDSQSWANWDAHPADRANRHESYDRYIIQEVVPFIHSQGEGNEQKILTTGASMGAYHTCNFFFRHPDIFEGMIALSGLYQLSMFIGDYMDQTVYFNTPLSYLPNLSDGWYLDQYRQSKIIVSVGQGAWEDDMLRDTRALEQILLDKGIPAWIDYWGQDVNHDWPWWQKQLPYFLEHILPWK
ncbi:MAG: alpha/beta hydrolase-fold protein [Anaerolineaceae bacterium]|nr:alpha/beta hydrolase-fold protein [Anaerolineaceae bacterium]